MSPPHQNKTVNALPPRTNPRAKRSKSTRLGRRYGRQQRRHVVNVEGARVEKRVETRRKRVRIACRERFGIVRTRRRASTVNAFRHRVVVSHYMTCGSRWKKKKEETNKTPRLTVARATRLRVQAPLRFASCAGPSGNVTDRLV